MSRRTRLRQQASLLSDCPKRQGGETADAADLFAEAQAVRGTHHAVRCGLR